MAIDLSKVDRLYLASSVTQRQKIQHIQADIQIYARNMAHAIVKARWDGVGRDKNVEAILADVGNIQQKIFSSGVFLSYFDGDYSRAVRAEADMLLKLADSYNALPEKIKSDYIKGKTLELMAKNAPIYQAIANKAKVS